MWLVLCEPTDLSAIWAWKGLRARGVEPIELVTSHALAYCLRFEHRIGRRGTTTMISLADGRTVTSAAVRGTLNRLVRVPTDHLQTANAQDQRYAEQELSALFLSWVHALPAPLINTPTPRGLGGARRPISEWTMMAARAGLPAAFYSPTDHDVSRTRDPSPADRSVTGLVLHGRCFGAMPDAFRLGCARLAELADTALLGVEFLARGGDWQFVSATPLPDLRQGGESLLHALAESLRVS